MTLIPIAQVFPRSPSTLLNTTNCDFCLVWCNAIHLNFEFLQPFPTTCWQLSAKQQLDLLFSLLVSRNSGLQWHWRAQKFWKGDVRCNTKNYSSDPVFLKSSSKDGRNSIWKNSVSKIKMLERPSSVQGQMWSSCMATLMDQNALVAPLSDWSI